MPFPNEETGAEEWLCAACCTETNGFLGQQQGPDDPQYVGDARPIQSHERFALVECCIYLRSDAPEEDKWLHGVRSGLLQQWVKISRILTERKWSRFHALIDYDDGNPFDLEWLVIMCRKNPHIPLVVASFDILPFRTDLSGVRLIVPEAERIRLAGPGS
jgi:hypothetical protein